MLAPFVEPQTPMEVDAPLRRLYDLGAGSLSNKELLSLLLEREPVANDHTPVTELAQQMLAENPSLGSLARCTPQELVSLHGITSQQAACVTAAGEFGRRAIREAFAKVTVNSPEIVCQLMVPECQALKQESIWILLLDSKRQLLRIQEIYRGSLRATVAHPREIFRPALIHSADSIILTHNHPSGNPMPSQQDNELTQQVMAAGKTLGIEVVDHVVIGAMQAGTPLFYSYKQEQKL